MLRTKKQVDRVRLFLRPSSAYFAFGNSIRKDAPKVGEEYKSSRTVRSSIPPPECAKHGTVLHRRGLPKLLKFFLMELYFSQDHSIWSHLWWLLGCLKCWFAKWPTILGCSTATNSLAATRYAIWAKTWITYFVPMNHTLKKTCKRCHQQWQDVLKID